VVSRIGGGSWPGVGVDIVIEAVLPAAMPAYFNLIELWQIVGYLEPRRFDIDIDVFVGAKLRIIVKSSSRNFN